MPIVFQKYRINKKLDRKLGILGPSAGGAIACYAGWTRGNDFNKCGCLSPPFYHNNEDFLNKIMKRK
jgi:predicted alpha/beta superfamily hydrolase